MTTEYTPSTEEVRELYWAVSGTPRRDSQSWDEFDRWLNEERAKVWDEAIQETYRCGWYQDFSRDDMLGRNPYRKDTP